MLYLELLLVFALIVLNGVLAMSELAVVSARPGRLRAMMERGVPGARTALALATDPGRFLSTVQVGITLVGILAGAFSGVSLGSRVSAMLTALGLDRAVAEPAGFALVITVITYFSLVVGELVPKQLALRNAEAIACRVAVPMRWLSWLATPFVWLLDGSGRFLIRLMGGTAVNENVVTDEEIRALIEEAETAGVIESGERSMIAGVMRLGDRPVRTFMTPLINVDMLGADDEPAALRRQITKSPHSRLPVHGSSPDELLGIIRAKDIADALLAGRKFDVKRLLKRVPSILESMPALEAMELFRDSAIHVAFVQDEYGRTLGILTPTDLLEAISGSMSTGADDEPRSVQREDGSWLLSGDMTVDELTELIGITLPSKRRFETVAGLMLDAFKYLPSLGEVTKVGQWRFEVVDLDGRRIDKVVASRLADTHRPGSRLPQPKT